MPTAGARHLLADRLRHPPPPPVATEPPLPHVLLSIKPHYARLIEAGGKRVEFRRRFPRQVERARAIFYLSSPTRAIALTATIVRVVRAAPSRLWVQFGPTSGTDAESFHGYFADADDGVALVLEDVE